MLEITLDRLEGFIPTENRLIVTHKDQADKTRATVGDLCPIVIAEPEARQTTAALATAALAVEQLHKKRGLSGSPVMISSC